MNFKFNKVGQNTDISHDLLYSMARNDDIIKEYYEASSLGILGWYETESSILVNAFDSDDEDDTEWHSICSISINAEENKAIKMSLRGLNVVHQAPNSAPSGMSTPYRHAMNARFAISSAEEESIVPYRFVASGRYVEGNQTRSMGRIFGHNVCFVTSEVLVWPASYTAPPSIIRPGFNNVKLEVKKLDVSQNIVATSDNKLQVLIEDLGPWYNVL